MTDEEYELAKKKKQYDYIRQYGKEHYKRCNLTLTNEEYDLIAHNAEILGMTASGYVKKFVLQNISNLAANEDSPQDGESPKDTSCNSDLGVLNDKIAALTDKNKELAEMVSELQKTVKEQREEIKKKDAENYLYSNQIKKIKNILG